MQLEERRLEAQRQTDERLLRLFEQSEARHVQSEARHVQIQERFLLVLNGQQLAATAGPANPLPLAGTIVRRLELQPGAATQLSPPKFTLSMIKRVRQDGVLMDLLNEEAISQAKRPILIGWTW